MTNIYEALRADHDKQRTLMKILVATKGASDGRQELFAKLRDELVSHADAEEQVFYARLMAENLTQPMARHGVAEHKQANDVIEELQTTDFDSPGWLPKMKQLQEVVLHHLDEEEHGVFQLSGKVLSETEKVELAQDFADTKRAKSAS